MEKNVKWDDSRDEIMNIIELIENDQEPQIPLKCPICNTNNAHIYMYRWDNDRGTIWTWCSNCKACTHGSRLKLPSWWENGNFIESSELASHPIFLEPKAHLIDKHLRQLLKKSIKFC